jgi:lysophospholipase L1-like esterase
LSSIVEDVEGNEGTDAPTRHALGRLAVVALSLAALSLATYALPNERLRPWVTGEGVPIARMFDDEDSSLPGFAEASTLAAPGAAATPTGTALAGSKPSASGGAQPARGASGPTLQIEKQEYDGISQQIENAKALDAFFAKLVRVGQRQPSAIARVAHYGDSSIASDTITSTARRLLQRRFGDAGHGFVLISRGYMHYNHKDVVHRSSRGWELFPIVMDALRPGFYGYGGVQVRGGGGEYVTVGTVKEGEFGRNVARFELFYQRFRGGGKLELKVDGKRHRVLETRGDLEDAWETIAVPDGHHSLTVRGLGADARLYGIALERDKPGVVYDSLGLVGAMGDRLLNAEPEHMRRQIMHRAPDLLVLGFGGNESGNKWLNIEQYEREMIQVLELMRAGRKDMSCMLFAPLDQAERDARGRVVTLPNVPKIAETQRRVAKAHGCAFFDAFSAMGGNGAMAKWLKARPRLATSDMRHATPAGYDLIGTMYYKALLKAFADYLTTRGSS